MISDRVVGVPQNADLSAINFIDQNGSISPNNEILRSFCEGYWLYAGFSGEMAMRNEQLSQSLHVFVMTASLSPAIVRQ
jgi:hypothetical protein